MEVYDASRFVVIEKDIYPNKRRLFSDYIKRNSKYQPLKLWNILLY